MKILILLSLVLFVSCKGGAGNPVSPSSASPTNGVYWNSRIDTNAQNVVYNVVNGNSTYYSSTSLYNDGDVWTIPEYININSDTLGTIHSDDYIELQIANRTTCHYYKMTNYFQFQGCSTVDTANITWTIQAGDSYYQSDLNKAAIVSDKNKVIFVLKRHSSCTGTCTMNGTINFSYDL